MAANKNTEAPIFPVANYGDAGGLLEVAPQLDKAETPPSTAPQSLAHVAIMQLKDFQFNLLRTAFFRDGTSTHGFNHLA